MEFALYISTIIELAGIVTFFFHPEAPIKNYVDSSLDELQ